MASGEGCSRKRESAVPRPRGEGSVSSDTTEEIWRVNWVIRAEPVRGLLTKQRRLPRMVLKTITLPLFLLQTEGQHFKGRNDLDARR